MFLINHLFEHLFSFFFLISNVTADLTVILAVTVAVAEPVFAFDSILASIASGFVASFATSAGATVRLPAVGHVDFTASGFTGAASERVACSESWPLPAGLTKMTGRRSGLDVGTGLACLAIVVGTVAEGVPAAGIVVGIAGLVVARSPEEVGCTWVVGITAVNITVTVVVDLAVLIAGSGWGCTLRARTFRTQGGLVHHG